jgi:hypothetical protein
MGTERRKLSGWEEVSAYLAVRPRAAQNYEKEHHLPIHRMPGEKGRVWAYTDELDVWQKVRDQPSSPSPAVPGTPADVKPARPRWLYYSLAGVILLLAAAAIIYAVVIPHGPPADFRVEGKNLIVINAKDQELWRHSFSVPMVQPMYIPERKVEHNWLGDLDGDNQVELLFTATPVNFGEVGRNLICFASDGRIKWQFTPGRLVTDQAGNRLSRPYFVASVQVFAGRTPTETRIAVSSNHHLSQADQVAVLDTRGRVIGEYWHPGHLLHSAQVDLDGDGRNELLLAGVNNGNHQATLVVLDPWQIAGLTTPIEMQDQRFRLLDMAPAKEKAVVFFPRSCLSHGQPYTRVQAVRTTADRLVLEVAEGIAESRAEEPTPVFVYELDYALNAVSVTPSSINVPRVHKELEARGVLDHPLTRQDWERLKDGVVVRRAK